MAYSFAPTERFVTRQAQVALMVFGAVIVVLGLAGIGDSSRVRGTVYILFGAFIIARAQRSFSVAVDATGATTRSLIRTRRYSFNELQSVEVAVGQVGLTGFGREYLVFHQSDGRNRVFKDLNGRKPKDPTANSAVRLAALCINARLRPS